MALYEIGGSKNATQIGKKTGRNPQMIMEWVHRYNEQSLEALKYQQTGGRLPLFIDEAHLHLDTDECYGWTVAGERAWISSSSSGLRKVSFYGVYIDNLGQIRYSGS